VRSIYRRFLAYGTTMGRRSAFARGVWRFTGALSRNKNCKSLFL